MRPSAETQQDFLHLYAYIVYVKYKMWDPNQAEAKKNPVFGAAPHSGVRQLMMSRTLAHAIHTHYKLRRRA